jgi:PKD repeat protein
MRWLPVLAAALAVAALLPPTSGATGATATMAGNQFKPHVLTIGLGQEVTWANQDPYAHRPVSAGGPASFDAGAVGSGESSAPVKFAALGQYNYTCTIHPGMNGVIIVGSAGGNQPPSPDFALRRQGLNVTVDASGSTDPDGQIALYTWRWGDGTRDSYGAKTSHKYADGGSYQLRLLVTDDKGAVASQVRTVTIADVGWNPAPVANFTLVANGMNVVADGSTSYDPEEPLDYVMIWAWAWGDGRSTTGAYVNHTYDIAGTYHVTLTVRDARGEYDNVTKEITVSRPAAVNQPPRSIFIPETDDLILTVDATNSFDPDGHVVAYEWDFGDGQNDSGQRTLHVYGAPGSYVVALTVFDDRGANASFSRTILVGPRPEAPNARLLVSAQGLSIIADASTSADPDGDIVSYAYDFGDGGKLLCDAQAACQVSGPGSSKASGGAARASHRYLRDGTYILVLTITDARGLTSESESPITLASDPKPSFTAVVSGSDVTLDASRIPTYSNPTYSWISGEVALGTGKRLTTTFATVGQHPVKLLLADAGGTLELTRVVVTTNNVVESVAPTQEKKSPGASAGAIVGLAAATALLSRRR